MKNYKLAWRNLWRNRRRTLITAASVFFAVFFALFFRSLQLGSYDHMFKNAIESYSGYLQVQQKDWWDEKTVDNSFPYTDELRQQLLDLENVEALIPRFESFALASSGPNTKGVMVLGIDPDKEDLLSNVREKAVKYRLTEQAIREMTGSGLIPEKYVEILEKHEGSSYSNTERFLLDMNLEEEDAPGPLKALEEYASFEQEMIRVGEQGVWLGDRLSTYLELSPGDTIVLLSQGYHGTTAAGKYPIKGIVKQPIPDVDSRVVYMPYDIAQGLFNAGNNLTSIALHIRSNDDDAIEETRHRTAELLPGDMRVMDWKQMNELLVSQMDADNKSGMIMIAILYLVIAFGVFGTVLMMTAERRREFGVLVAIGMQKRKLASIISYEMLYIGLLGILLGVLIGAPAITYGHFHPIIFRGEMAMMFEDYGMEPKMVFEPVSYYFLSQALIVGVMVLVALFYPVRKIISMEVVNALRT
jgi:ABC-type lipoprotein release transport system permease subunit